MEIIGSGFPVLGTKITDNGVNFAIYAKEGREITLKICDEKDEYIFPLKEEKNRTGNIWHLLINGCKEGHKYIWEIDGNKILDPYACSFTGEEECEKKRNIIVKKNEDKCFKHPNTPWKDTIIYEMHVGLFTKNKNSKVKNLGTYSGIIEKIPHLKELGITAVELLPVYEWDDYTGRYNAKNELLTNIWGYNPINFFALSKKYATDRDKESISELKEFKELVRILHENGIEVILDVVYNHTAEGGHGGKIYNFKKMSNKEFYILENNNQDYTNYSGCGNTFSCNIKVSKDMIIDSLRYWYIEMGVDGFRFDLAPILGRDKNGQWGSHSVLDDIAEDPILSRAKLISESWDLGGYYVGDMPVGFSEWNGKYRDVVRKFIKGDYGQVGELLKRIFGSYELFIRKESTPFTSINFITCHDGFTLNDLVSYNNKHNLDNGEKNRDGESINNSYNCGEEGETENKEILKLRMQQMKNFMMILFISQGTPMILMGDEFARTQNGNNNAYCQDNISTWVDWSLLEKNRELFNFVKNMIEFRKKYSIFHSDRYLDSDDTKKEDIILHGVKLNKPDLSYHSLSTAFEIFDKESKNDFYIAINSYYKELTFELPGEEWEIIVDTSKNISFQKKILEEDKYIVESRSAIILKKLK